jgi:hypothetical protein
MRLSHAWHCYEPKRSSSAQDAEIINGATQNSTNSLAYLNIAIRCILPFSVKHSEKKMQDGTNRIHRMLGLKLLTKPIMCIAARTHEYMAQPKKTTSIPRNISFILYLPSL